MVVTGGLETGAGRPGGGYDQLKSREVPTNVRRGHWVKTGS